MVYGYNGLYANAYIYAKCAQISIYPTHSYFLGSVITHQLVRAKHAHVYVYGYAVELAWIHSRIGVGAQQRIVEDRALQGSGRGYVYANY